MKSLMKKEMKIMGRSVPIFVVFLVLMAGTAVALLTTYITVEGTAEVKQSVTLNAIESTWKYPILPYEEFPDGGVTEASWILGPEYGAVGSDIQDVGLLLSNYAQKDADVELVETVTGPDDVLYEECVDLTKEFYDDYTPSYDLRCKTLDVNDCNALATTCSGYLDQATCEGGTDFCEWRYGVCESRCVVATGCTVDISKADPTEKNFKYCQAIFEEQACNQEYNCTWIEHCKGDEHCTGELLASEPCTDDVWKASKTVAKRPDDLDPTKPTEDWVCVRHKWDIAAVPGTYGFVLNINPPTIT